MLASAQKLDSLVAVVDFNKWQATGRSTEILAIEPLAQKFESFGWRAVEVDGHDVAALQEAIFAGPDGSGRPQAVIAHTVKGKGVSFMEDDNNWHYRVPTADEVRSAHRELGLVPA
jgi:transketolase